MQGTSSAWRPLLGMVFDLVSNFNFQGRVQEADLHLLNPALGQSWTVTTHFFFAHNLPANRCTRGVS